jgi:predicted DNA-binding ribbon-helix-helix protein
MPAPVKRSVTIAGHRTSISLEPEFWQALKEIADTTGRPVAAVIAEIDSARGGEGLSTAARLHVLRFYRERAARATPTP